MTIKTGLQIQRTLQVLKQSGATEGHAKVAYAVDKSLEGLEDALEIFYEHQQKALSEHGKRDQNGRRILNIGDKTFAAEEDDDYNVKSLFEVNSDQRVTDVPQENGWIFELEDEDAAQNQINSIKEEDLEVDLHRIDRDLFLENIDVSGGLASQISLTTLDPLFK